MKKWVFILAALLLFVVLIPAAMANDDCCPGTDTPHKWYGPVRHIIFANLEHEGLEVWKCSLCEAEKEVVVPKVDPEIIYSLYGGTNHPDNPKKFPNGTTVTLQDPTRTGYTFMGWYYDVEFTKRVTTVKQGSDPEYPYINVRARWRKNGMQAKEITICPGSYTFRYTYQTSSSTSGKYAICSSNINVLKASFEEPSLSGQAIYQSGALVCYEHYNDLTFKAINEGSALVDYYFGNQPIDLFKVTVAHNWGDTEYTWSDDNKKVTAKRVCAENTSHVETETVAVTCKVTKEATTKATGTAVYTATFQNPAFKIQKKTVTIAKYPATFTDKNCKYKISDNLMATVAGPATSTQTVVSIPATITVNGKVMNVVGINANAFKGKTKIRTVSVGKNVKTIGNNAFYGCTALTKVSGMAAITSIGSGAFRGCTALTTITIPAKVTTVGDNAFYGCKKLKTVGGMAAVKKIGAGAFQQCSALVSFTIPANVASIGKNAFYDCNSLKKVTIKSTKLTDKNVGANAFGKNPAKATYICPAAKLKAYKTLLPKKGVSKTATIK